MSQLTIGPELGKGLDWAVGEEYTFPTTGTVTSMKPDGSYVLDVTSVSEPEEEIPEEEVNPPRGPSAVNAMLGKY